MELKMEMEMDVEMRGGDRSIHEGGGERSWYIWEKV